MTNTPRKTPPQKVASKPQTAQKPAQAPGAQKGTHKRSQALPDVRTLITAYGMVSGAADEAIIRYIREAQAVPLPEGTYWFDSEGKPINLYADKSETYNTDNIDGSVEPDFISTLLAYCDQPVVKARVTEYRAAASN